MKPLVQASLPLSPPGVTEENRNRKLRETENLGWRRAATRCRMETDQLQRCEEKIQHGRRWVFHRLKYDAENRTKGKEMKYTRISTQSNKKTFRHMYIIMYKNTHTYICVYTHKQIYILNMNYLHNG